MRGGLSAAVAAAVLMTGCTSSAPGGDGSSAPDVSSPAVGALPENVHQFGDPVRVAVDGAAARVTVSKPCAVGTSLLGGANGKVYAVHVTVAGLSGTFDLRPRDFAARDRAGDTFDLDRRVDGHLDASSLPPGDTLRGLVAFDVARGKRIAAVHFLSALGDPVATWRAGSSHTGSTPRAATSC